MYVGSNLWAYETMPKPTLHTEVYLKIVKAAFDISAR